MFARPNAGRAWMRDYQSATRGRSSRVTWSSAISASIRLTNRTVGYATRPPIFSESLANAPATARNASWLPPWTSGCAFLAADL
jgi:hypothetical protein